MRAAIRGALYQARKYELGCPTEEKCELLKMDGGACSHCPKHLVPVEPDPEAAAGTRLRFLVRVESLINVGCKFGPNDLPASVWDELTVLAIERQRMDRIIMEQRDKARQQDAGVPAGAELEMAKARRETGIPPPGGSIFPRR